MGDGRNASAVFDFDYELRGDLSEPCVYCGHPATEWDHVPPLHFIARLKELDRNNYVLRKYPCCHECNSALGSLVLSSLEDRRARIKRYLRKKYRKWLEMPEWSELDLAELSNDDARKYIKNHAKFARLVKQRLAW